MAGKRHRRRREGGAAKRKGGDGPRGELAVIRRDVLRRLDQLTDSQRRATVGLPMKEVLLGRSGDPCVAAHMFITREGDGALMALIAVRPYFEPPAMDECEAFIVGSDGTWTATSKGDLTWSQ